MSHQRPYACWLEFRCSALNEELKELIGPENQYDGGWESNNHVFLLQHSNCSSPGFEDLESYLVQHEVAFNACNLLQGSPYGSFYRMYRPVTALSPEIDIRVPCDREGELVVEVEELRDILRGDEEVKKMLTQLVDEVDPYVPGLELY